MMVKLAYTVNYGRREKSARPDGPLGSYDNFTKRPYVPIGS